MHGCSLGPIERAVKSGRLKKKVILVEYHHTINAIKHQNISNFNFLAIIMKLKKGHLLNCKSATNVTYQFRCAISILSLDLLNR